MSWLITGATGFLGGHVLHALGRAGLTDRCVLLVRDVGRARLAAPGAEHAHEPLRRLPMIEAPLHDCTAIARQLRAHGPLAGIVHMAAPVHHSRIHAQQMHEGNAVATAAMVQLARAQGARLVFVSSSGTVGCSRDAAAAPAEDAPLCRETVAHWPYYAAKIAAEDAVAAGRAQGLQATVLRPPVMLGPGDSRFRATGLLVRYLTGRLPFYLNGGMHLTDVRDVADAVVAAMQLAAPPPVVHLPGAAMPLGAYFGLLERLTGVPAPRRALPHAVAWPIAALGHQLGLALRGRPLTWLADPVLIEMGRHHWGLSSHACAALGYRARPADETLRDTVAWLRQHHPALSGA